MAQKVSIGIDANLDTSAVEQKINALGKKVAQANKVQFNPVSVNSIDQVAKLEKQFQQLLKVHGELNRRVKNTGQTGKGFMGMDYEQIFPDAKVRNRQMQNIMAYTLGAGAFGPGTGGGGGGPGPGIPSHPARPGGGNGGGGGMGTRVAQAGLSALGPAGGVASSALGTGMSAGFGAGLMGLLGGMLALGVGKLVSGVMEKVGQAEDNSVAMDKLKRTLGDVNVQFEGLKAVVQGGAENLKITYAEAGKLATQFAKLGNMKAGEYTSLNDEMGVGVGLARSFGLDPSEGIGVMGQMRGVGVTGNTQDSKRFALLIGETIAKSDAFAKADEVIGAIGSFATSQTRNNMGAANVAGYAGAFSGLVGSGIPGLDPSGAGALLGRINASLSAGGAKGEASQYFTGMVGQGMGLNPYQTRMLREGGAFATKDSMFGEGSAYARYKGRSGPSGGATFMQASVDRLRKQYGSGSDELADATANHLGIGINQAMALLSVKPNQMGGMSKYANLTSMSGAGIGNLSKALYGSGAERKGLAESLMRRSDVSEDEKARIKGAMASGNEDSQKQVLAEIVAQRDQEQTTGKDVRDSKNSLDNIKMSIADKLVPYMNEARMGIMAIAGVGKGKTTDGIMRDVIEANSKGRQDAITGQFAPEVSGLKARKQRADSMMKLGDPVFMEVYKTDPKRAEEMRKERDNAMKVITEVDKRLAEIESEKADLLEKENFARKRELEELDKAAAKRAMAEITEGDDAVPTGGGVGSGVGGGYGGSGGRGSGGGGKLGADPASINEAMKYFMGQGWSKEQSAGIVSNLVAESGLRQNAVGDGGKAYGVAQWHPDRQAAFKKWAGHDIRESSRDEQYGFVNYELTEGRYKNVGDKLKTETAPDRSAALVSRRYEVPADSEGEASRRAAYANTLGTVQVEVIHKNEKGQEVAPRQITPTKVQSNWTAHGPR